MRAAPDMYARKDAYSKKDRFWDKDLRRSLIINYIRAHEGEKMDTEILSNAAKYSAITSAARVITELINSGKITREHRGRGKGYTYRLQGKVEVKVPAKENVEKMQRIHDEAQEARQSGETQFAENLDLFIWEYLLSLTTNSAYTEDNAAEFGRFAHPLREFSKFMHSKAENKQETLTDGAKAQETDKRRSSETSSDDQTSIRY
jgi:predicted transcriptional regulator